MDVENVPVIETARLVLRRHRLQDLDPCAAMWADPIVTRFISGNPSSLQQSWSRLLSYVGHWTLLRFGYWAVEEKSSGHYVGELGFADFKRNIEPALAGVPELGYALVARAHGKGYAKEAVRAAIDWSDAQFKWKSTICIIDPDNAASIRIAENIGYREAKRINYRQRPTIVFIRNR